MKKTLSLILAAALTLSLAACSAGPASDSQAPAASQNPAQSTQPEGERVWPTTKTVEITCPASAGGLTDSAARIWANYLSTAFPGTNFIVNNDNTGNGSVAMEKIRNSTATDGSELLFYNTNMQMANYTGAYEYKLMEDFQFITVGYATNPDGFMLCVAGDSPYETMDDLMDDIKARPGELVTGVQNGSTRQFLAGAMKAATETDFKTVDTGNESDTITALLGGNIQFAFVQAANADQYRETGDMKALGICQPTRSDNYPDVPTMDEQGYPNMNLNSLQYVVGPKGMSEEVANAIAATMEGYANDPTVQNALANMKVSYEYTTRQECIDLAKERDELFGAAASALGY